MTRLGSLEDGADVTSLLPSLAPNDLEKTLGSRLPWALLFRRICGLQFELTNPSSAAFLDLVKADVDLSS
jgi:hypothetical protein